MWETGSSVDAAWSVSLPGVFPSFRDGGTAESDELETACCPQGGRPGRGKS